jgi:Leucine-rich repeat (LRR) protein
MINCFTNNTAHEVLDCIFQSLNESSYTSTDIKVFTFAAALFLGGAVSLTLNFFQRQNVKLLATNKNKDKNKNCCLINEVYKKSCFKSHKIEFVHTRLHEFPFQILQLEHLTHLTLVNAGLNKLPDSLARLQGLTYMNLSGNFFKLFPRQILLLKNLSHLSLRANSLKTIEVDIDNLTELTYLDLSDNYLHSFPLNFLALTKLSELYIENNCFLEVPKVCLKLCNLRVLSLSENKITSFDDVIFQPSIKYLDVSLNRLKVLDKAFILLEELCVLVLSANQISFLGDSLDNLSKLESLHLSNNRLEGLPNSFAFLKNLKKLDVSFNDRLTSLPLSLGTILNLEEIQYLNTRIGLNQLEAISDLKLLSLQDDSLITFESRLAIWLGFAGICENLQLIFLTFIEKADALEWFIWLERSKDFQSDQCLIAKAVIDIIKNIKDPLFKEVFFVQIRANLSDCEDRAIYNLILLNIYKELYSHQRRSIQEELAFLVRAAKSLYLPQVVSIILLKEKIVEENTEVFLYVYSQLSGPLDLLLPYPNLSMHYKEYAETLIGRGEDPDLSDVVLEVNKLSKGALLVKQVPHFVESFLKRYFLNYIQEIDNKRFEELSCLDDLNLSLTDLDYQSKLKSIQDNYESKILQLIDSI